jgi:hypothetical protein
MDFGRQRWPPQESSSLFHGGPAMSLPKTSIVRHFAGLPDPRLKPNRLHQLCDMIAIALCAVICGAESWEDVAEYGRTKESWLKSFLHLEHGVPSHDTFNRVFRLLKPKPFQACFSRWMVSVPPSAS